MDLRGSVLISCLKEMQILKEQGACIKSGNKTVLARKGATYFKSCGEQVEEIGHGNSRCG